MSLAWNGSAGTWDINTTAAWNTSDVFYNADDVTFGTTAGTTTVSILSAVMPASITVNSTNDYTFSTTTPTGGSPLGKITGDVGLVKQGTGTLILNLANDYTGVTNIQGGTLRIGVGRHDALEQYSQQRLGRYDRRNRHQRRHPRHQRPEPCAPNPSPCKAQAWAATGP